MTDSSYNRWLHRFAVLTALATLGLIALGGLVTSHEAGMSVPDWPNSYGYNMFLFPPSKWIGGILYEHTHRLLASTVGLLVVALMRWLGGRESRRPLAIVGALEVLAGLAIFALFPAQKATGGFLTGIGGIVFVTGLGGRRASRPSAIIGALGMVVGMAFCVFFPEKKAINGLLVGASSLALFAALMWRCERTSPRPLPQLGWLAFVLVQVQGLLGGLRVVLFKDQIGIFHATLAQLFFVLLCAIVLLTSKWWMSAGNIEHRTSNSEARIAPASKLQLLFVCTTVLILFQLILGATMRHQHAGLAIHDFPLAYGKLWPATDPVSVAKYNEHRVEITNFNPITAFQIELQMVHRIVAVLILCAVSFCAWKVRSSGFSRSGKPPEGGTANVIRRLAFAWLGLILCQVALGAATVLLDKAADIATAHVIVGALSLATGTLISIIAVRFSERAAGILPADAVLKNASTANLNGAMGISSAGKISATR